MAKRYEVEGVIAGGAGVVIWENWPGHEEFRARILRLQSPLAFLEHYHWGLAAILADKTLGWKGFGYGVGGTLIASEFAQEMPFGTGKSDWEVKGNLSVAFILGLLLLDAFS